MKKLFVLPALIVGLILMHADSIKALTVTISSSPSAGGTTSGAGAYTNGQSVTLTATPNACYNFTSWTIKAKVQSTNTSYTFTIGTSEALVANFTLKEDAITTASNPAKGGSTTGKGTYGCGKTVTLKATAAAGYKFSGWSVDASPGGSGITVSFANPYTFQAEGAALLTANFSDVSVPTLTITSPTANEKVETTLLAISGTAKNVLGVSNVVLSINGGEVSAATTTNNWTNWSATAILSPGANVISANALSEVGTLSKTSIITVENTAVGEAPVALAGLIGEVQMGTNAPFQVSFGAATFEQFSQDTNQDSGVGNYTYIQTGPNTAVFSNNAFAPPDKTGGGGAIFSFTSTTTAVFTNDDGTTGTLTLSPGSSLVFGAISGWTFVSEGISFSTTTTFGDGAFLSTDSNGTNRSGGYTSTQYGPMATMVVETNIDPYFGGVETNYILARLISRTNGQFFSVTYNGVGGAPSYDYGTFTGTYHASGLDYLAPESLNGMSAVITEENQGPSTLTFGQATLAKSSSSTNVSSKVVDYTYARTGITTAVLSVQTVAPPSSLSMSDNSDTLYLTFKSASGASFTNLNGDHGKMTFATIPQADYFAPAALPPVVTYDFNSVPSNEGGSATLNYGNFAIYNSSGNPNGKSGTYTYSQFSPTVGMIIFTCTDQADVGLVEYIQSTFNSTTGGSGLGDAYETKNNGQIEIGSFKLVK